MYTSAPNFVDFNITNRCNMNCEHCYVGGSGDMSIRHADAVRILTDLAEIGVFKVALTGGEPFLHPQWRGILDHIIDVGIYPMVNTNGTTLSERTIDDLYRSYGPGSIQFAVSLDGADATTFAVLRRWADGSPCTDGFDQVLNTIGDLAEHGFVVGINFAFTAMNGESIYRLHDLIDHRFAQYPELSINVIKFGQSGLGAVHADSLEVSYSDWTRFLLEATRRKARNELPRLHVEPTCPWEVYMPLQGDFGIAQIESLWNYRSPLRNPLYAECRDIGCHAGISNVVVNWDGSVYPCGLYPDNQLACIGNALEEPFASIWEKSVMLREIRALTLETIGQPCTECELRNLCGGGCRGAASLMTGAYAGLDLRCPIVKDWYVRNTGTPTMGELR